MKHLLILLLILTSCNAEKRCLKHVEKAKKKGCLTFTDSVRITDSTPSDLDIYINNIVDKLRAKYGYADKNRLMKRVRFYHYKYTYGRWMMRGAEESDNETEVIELTYTELEESMNKNELPNKIQKLL